MKKISFLMLVFAAFSLLWFSCNKEEKVVAPPAPGNEFLTTVKLIATNAADGTDVQTAKWVDLNPDGGTPDLSQATLNLRKNAVYNVEVLFLDETKNPVEDITTEVRERANYHLVCYSPYSGLNLTIVRTDKDTNVPALELGLTTTFTTGAISAGNLEVSLHHQPNVKNGDCDRGSTDVEVNFSVNIL
jgi:hypothetical protein